MKQALLVLLVKTKHAYSVFQELSSSFISPKSPSYLRFVNMHYEFFSNQDHADKIWFTVVLFSSWNFSFVNN